MRSEIHGLRRIQIRSLRRAARSLRARPVKSSQTRTVELLAPSHFSIIDNPQETVAFLQTVRRTLHSSDVRAALRNVQVVSSDALLALITYADSLSTGTMLTGDLPVDSAARQAVETCGFAELVRGLERRGTRRSFVETASASARSGHHANAKQAEELVQRGCAAVGLPYSPVSYSNLIECMTNTNNHAGQTQGTIAWRLMVTCDETAQRLQFVFMDPGQGICRTVKRRFPQFSDDSELLRVLMDPAANGFLKLWAGLPARTRTGQPGRGRGLRKIAQSLQRGSLRRLVVIANEGYLDVGTGTTARLKGYGFQGTLVFWEVGQVA